MAALEVIEKLIAEHSPKPTELLEIATELTYNEVNDVITELVDTGRVVLDSDHHLRVKDKA